MLNSELLKICKLKATLRSATSFETQNNRGVKWTDAWMPHKTKTVTCFEKGIVGRGGGHLSAILELKCQGHGFVPGVPYMALHLKVSVCNIL